jgi:hypothetical protein
MENRLSDVHSIAGELLRRGEIGQDITQPEGSRIVRVERQTVARSPAMIPVAAPPGFDQEIHKLSTAIEAIRRSVEFTEAHLALSTGSARAPKGDAEPVVPARRGWAKPFLIAANLALLAMLLAEIHDNRVGMTIFALYDAFGAALSG